MEAPGDASLSRPSLYPTADAESDGRAGRHPSWLVCMTPLRVCAPESERLLRAAHRLFRRGLATAWGVWCEHTTDQAEADSTKRSVLEEDEFREGCAHVIKLAAGSMMGMSWRKAGEEFQTPSLRNHT